MRLRVCSSWRYSQLEELALQRRHLHLELLYQDLHLGGRLLDVRSCLVHDLLGSLRELEGLDGLLQVSHLFTGCADERRLRIATKRVLQEESQLGVSERDVSASVSERLDADTKGCQTQVDLLCLFEDLARGAGLRDTLTSCQVDKVESTDFLRTTLVLLNVFYNKDRVTPGASVVLICRRGFTHSLSDSE